MSDETQDTRFLDSVRALLDQSTVDLQPDVVACLRQTRREALAARSRRLPLLVWAGGLATAAVAILAMVIWWPVASGPRHHEVSLDDMELLTSGESLDVYDDLDFYRWLADAERES